MSNTSHQPTTATRVTDPDSDPSRATSYHVTKTSPPCQTKCRPHTQPPPQTAAHRARQICLIGMAEGQRVVSSPGSPSRSSQRGASRPPRTWRARPTGVLVIDCFSRALSTGCAGWVRPGSWTTLARSRCGRRSRTSATTVTPTPLQRNSLQQLAIGCNSTRRDCAQRLGCSRLSTMSRRRWSHRISQPTPVALPKGRHSEPRKQPSGDAVSRHRRQVPLPFIAARQWRSQLWPIPDRATYPASTHSAPRLKQ